eukprot:6869018-Karenia_brevis.AAC.1
MAANVLVESGHLVEMTAAGGKATHMKSGKTWEFSRRRGVFEADVEIVPFASSKYASQLTAKTQGTSPCVASLELYR